MEYYYHKSTGARIEAMQYNGPLDNGEVALFVKGLRRTGTFGLIGPGAWIVKGDDNSYYVCSNHVFMENYSPLTQEEPMRAQPPSSVVRRYYNKVVSEVVEAMQYNSDADRDTFLAFTQGLRNIGYDLRGVKPTCFNRWI